MAKTLSPLIQDVINEQYIKTKFVLNIAGKDASNYLLSFNLNSSKEFGSMQATFSINNSDYRFTDGGINEIFVGDVVDFDIYYQADLNQKFDRFYGFVNQKGIVKTNSDRSIDIVCLDYISITQFMDIDLEVEGDKILVEDEVLTPTYLPSPNENLAQIFDFANNSLADNPLPSIMIKNKNTAEEDPQFDGFSILYSEGQLKLGFPLNAKYNYDLMATMYYFYVKGKYAEDIIKEILIQPDGYSKYLFNETSQQASKRKLMGLEWSEFPVLLKARWHIDNCWHDGKPLREAKMSCFESSYVGGMDLNPGFIRYREAAMQHEIHFEQCLKCKLLYALPPSPKDLERRRKVREIIYAGSGK